MIESPSEAKEQANRCPSVFIIDVDGVMTTGHMFCSADGKVMKVFGADDNDALSLLKPYLEIRFITGDKRGFAITNKRICEDMGFPLDLVSTIRRIDWIRERYSPDKVIYMADGIFDHYVMREVAYAIAPANADKVAKRHAHYVTERAGGDRAVAEACLHIMEKFFSPYDPTQLPSGDCKLSGEWSV
jgi:3-deoxy-D-manno-octulosonate 8-phosphate phosphatase (KDO 8-P phosphatase)